jgi:5-methylcytosine-specific restriction endonuclease McrA
MINRSDYPKNWKRLAQDVRKIMPYCQICGSTNYLATAHINQDALTNHQNCILTVLCGTCHKKYDTRKKNEKQLELF